MPQLTPEDGDVSLRHKLIVHVENLFSPRGKEVSHDHSEMTHVEKLRPQLLAADAGWMSEDRRIPEASRDAADQSVGLRLPVFKTAVKLKFELALFMLGIQSCGA